MAGHAGNVLDPDWLREHYPKMTDINELLDDHEREFGWRPQKTSVYLKANRLGIHKAPVNGRDDRAERSVYWSKEPEMQQWMLEHDHGQRVDTLSDEFRERWGFGLTRGQINLFRSSHHTQRRNSHGGGKHPVPMYSEREGKDGYIVIKVREFAGVPMSKDNWMLKHVWIYEQTHGKVPEGHVVYFADGDRRNFDPDNLVAVPRKLIGIMNAQDMPKWYDRESLIECMSIAKLKSKMREVEFSATRICTVCGKPFVPSDKQKKYRDPPKTCPDCCAKGHKARKIDRKEVFRLHAMGLNYSEIARKLNCSSHQVSAIVKEG